MGQRSVTVLTSNRFPCPNDTLHDVMVSRLFQFSAAIGGDHADDAAWSYVFKGEFVIILVRDYRLILRSQAFFVLEA